MVKTTLARVYETDNNKLKRIAKRKKKGVADIIHSLLANKRGVVDGIVAIIFVLFFFAIASIVSIKVWNDFNNEIQGLDSSIADNSTKESISSLGVYVNWADKLFTFVIITLLIGLLITSFTLPTESYWLLIAYFGVLILITIIAMFLSNTWTVLVNNPALISSLSSLSFTDFVMRTFPYIVFFTGVLAGLIFYLRARNTQAVTGGFGGEDF